MRARSQRGSGWAVALFVGAGLAAPASPVTAQEEAPIDSELRERVDVRLVLVDAVVLDRRGRTVPGLGIDDFELTAGGRPVEIETLDTDCPLGRAGEPRPGAWLRKSRRWMPRPDRPPASPRRIVLVFDYAHIVHAAEAIEFAIEAVDELGVGNERHMVVALGATLRIEQEMTADREAVRRTLLRMRDDPSLYFGNHRSATLFPYFRNVRALLQVLERIEGRKLVVWFSGRFGTDGFFHDRDFAEIGALASRARAAIYAVDTAGLTYGGSLLGPPMLRRLAIDSGGRMTAGTNDLTLAYARAQRDAGCSYTLGFRDERASVDRDRALSVRVRGGGLRVVHPGFYVVRSGAERRRQALEAAELAPEMFESDALDLSFRLGAPRSRRRWNAEVGVQVRLPPGEVATWNLRGWFRRASGTAVRGFERTVELPAADTGQRTASLSEPVQLRPGRYRLCLLLEDPERDEPQARTLDVTVPELPLVLSPGGRRSLLDAP